MAVFSNIAGQEPSTVTFRVATVQIARGSTNEQQELLTLADPESSIGLARIVAAAPDSTHYGVVVRQVGYTAPSTTVQVSSLGGVVSVLPAAGASVRVEQSSAADLQAQVAQASTVWAVQAAQAGTWTVRANVSSTAADNPVSAAQASTVWAVQLSNYSTIVSVAALPSGILSTAAPSSNSSGVIVRQVVDVLTTFASTAACASTTIAVQSSAANLRSYVTAFTVLSTIASATEFGFYSSNTLLWPLLLQAVSSGVTGANLAVAAPGYLFRTDASVELSFRSPASTVAGVRLGVSYFRAP